MFCERKRNVSSIKHMFCERERNVSSIKHMFCERKRNVSSIKHMFCERKRNVSSIKHMFCERERNVSRRRDVSFTLTKHVSYDLILYAPFSYKRTGLQFLTGAFIFSRPFAYGV